MPDPFDPHKTIPLNRSGVPLWIFAVFALTTLAGAAGFVAWYEYARPVEKTPVAIAAPPPVAHDAPAPQETPVLPYAAELAAAQEKTMNPSPQMVQEFDSLLRRAREEYGRSTDMQIRDAIWSVFSLYVYNRPDIDLLKAARMIVDWAPVEVRTVSNDSSRTTAPTGEQTRTEGESGQRLVVENMPVSRAVDAITNDIVTAYTDAVRAQWEAYYAQQAAQNAQRVARAAQEEAILQAQAQAAAQAQIARDQAIAEQQRWFDQHSVFGQYWRR